MPRVRPVATLIALLLASIAPAQTPRPDGCVRVGTWNLEHFGERDTPRTDADLTALATFIRRLEVDVLAVQEIRTPAKLAEVARRVGPRWRSLVGTTGMFRDGTSGIRLGFVWNDERVELQFAEELLHLPRRVGEVPIFHRVPVSAVFRDRASGLDFRAVTVHLKASRGPKNEQKRRLEAAQLRRFVQGLAAVPGEDRDILILGDFNHTYGAPAHDVLAPTGSGLRYLESSTAVPTIVHFDEPIDHVCIASGLSDDVVADSRTVQGRVDGTEAHESAWRRTYSDHYPVTVDLRAGDRDPDATFSPPGEHQVLPAERRPDAPRAAVPATVRSGALVERPGPTAAPHPFPAGKKVLITFLGGGSTQGTLAADLAGDWVYVDEDHGGRGIVRVAYPTSSVRNVQGR